MGIKFSEKRVDMLLEKYRFRNSETGLIRLPIEREASLLEIVRKGEWQKAESLNGIVWVRENLGIAAEDPKKNMEYYTVACIAMEGRSAIEGGMPPEDTYDLSDVLLQELEKTKTIDEVNEIFKISVAVFAKGVYNARRKSNSYVLEQCKTYIHRRIYQKIALREIAAFVGLSEKYVSRLFSEREGISLRDFIQKEKIDAACKMLTYSNKSIAEISQNMGFQSQSNFGVVFRKWTQMTPTQYRALYHQDNYSFHK